jgi:hypothetical protein
VQPVERSSACIASAGQNIKARANAPLVAVSVL